MFRSQDVHFESRASLLGNMYPIEICAWISCCVLLFLKTFFEDRLFGRRFSNKTVFRNWISKSRIFQKAFFESFSETVFANGFMLKTFLYQKRFFFQKPFFSETRVSKICFSPKTGFSKASFRKAFFCFPCWTILWI